MGLLKVSCAQGLPNPPSSCQMCAELQGRLKLSRACSPLPGPTALCCPSSLSFHLTPAASSCWGFPGCG